LVIVSHGTHPTNKFSLFSCYYCTVYIKNVFSPCIAVGQWSELLSDVNYSRNQAFAEGTRANFRTQLKAYLLFCTYFNCLSVPAAITTIEAYVQFLSRSFKSVQSIRNYLNGVRFLHLLHDAPIPSFSSWQIKLLLRGITRVLLHTPKRALPITPPILLQLHSVLNLSSPLHATLWCCYLLSFYLFARKSNMVCPSSLTFNHHKHLQRKDIAVCPFGLLVTLKWSKTNQFSKRCLRVPVVSVPGSPLCPVKAFIHMSTLIPSLPSSPAFHYHSPKGPKGLVPITHLVFTSMLRSLLSQVGYNPTVYSGHSFRRGGATWAFKSGVPGELIQLHGDWRSDAYKVYLECDLKIKLAVSSAIRQSIYDL
jgi:hypothetical protein